MQPEPTFIIRRPGFWLLSVLAAMEVLAPSRAAAASPNIVIAEIYGGSGPSAPFRSDYIVLFNRGNFPAFLGGWSVQYASATGAVWQVTALPSAQVLPGGYFLIQEFTAGGTAPVLPPPDAIGTIDVGTTVGKVALVNDNLPLAGPCPSGPNIVDFVGYGLTANCFEGGGRAPAPGITTAVRRQNNGCTETDNNASDFVTGPPNPRNVASPIYPCEGPVPPSGVGAANPAAVIPGELTLLTITVTPGANPPSTGLSVVADLSAIGGSFFQPLFDDGIQGDVAAGDNVFSIETPVNSADVPANLLLPFTVSDGEFRSSGGQIGLFVVQLVPIAHLRSLQDSVNWLPLDTVSLFRIEGIVTTHVNVTTPANALFYIQDPSAAIAVFVSGGGSIRPAAGDLVRVTGPLGHFNGLLELNLSAGHPAHSVVTLGAGNSLPSATPLDFSDTDDVFNTETFLEGRRMVATDVFLDLTSPNFPAVGNVTMTDNFGRSFDLRIDARVTDIAGQPKPSGPVTITGVLAQSDTTDPRTSGYQLLPTRLADIIGATAYSIQIFPGWNLIANQLDRGGNTLSEILPTPPEGSTLQKWHRQSQSFQGFDFFDSGFGGWVDGNTLLPSTTALHPGEAAFFNSPTFTTLTFSGSPRAPVLPVPIPPDVYYYLSRQNNDVGTYENIVGTAPAEGTRLYRFQPGSPQVPEDPTTWSLHTYAAGIWFPVVPLINVGEAVAVFIPSPSLPPEIFQQPADQTVQDCGPAQFQVVASGNPPLSYQWMRDGTDLPGQINPILALPGVGLGDTGGYSVRVSNPGGSVTSLVVQLIVLNAPPTVTAPSAVTVNADAGLCSASGVNLGAATAIDECGSLPVGNNAPPVFPLGLTVVTWTAVDRNGDSASALQNVIVTDRQPPTITLPANPLVECAGPAGTPASFAATATDNCGGSRPVTYSHQPGSLFPLGVTTVTVSANDTNGNSTNRSFTVTVRDTTPPAITVPANLTVECAGGAGTPVSFAATATDTCGGNLPVTYSHQPNSLFSLGTTTVSVTATDGSGNSSNRTFTVTVRDTTLPSITVPANLTVECAGGAGTPVNFTASATDTCGGNLPVTYSRQPGSLFTLGTTTVNVTATDGSGNSSNRSFTVTVRDTTPPTVTVPANLIVECAGPAGTPASFTASATDTCGGNLPVTYSRQPGSLFTLGTTTVNVTATDASNNSTSRSFMVTVRDTTAPTVTVPADMSVDCAGPAGTPASFAASATDTCGGNLPVSYSHPPGSLFPSGVTTVNVTATDGGGNAASRSFTVTVRDTTPPRPVVCLDPPVVIEQGGRGVPSGTPAMPRPDLLASLQGQPTRSFDQTTPPGAVFAHSWENVTECVSDSTLVIGLAASGPTAQDDVVSLGFAEGGQFIPVWSGRLGLGGPPNLALLTPGPWLPGAQAVISLDLARLPLAGGDAAAAAGGPPPGGGTLDLIGLIAQRRFLDLAIGNDTTVDFTALTIGSCRDRADVLVDTEPGRAGAVVNYEYPGFTDACDPAPVVSSTLPPGTFFPIGTTLVPVTAIDGAGNEGRSWFRIDCRDRESPTIQCSPLQLECTKPSGAAVFYRIQARDNSGRVSTQCFPPSGSVFPIGVTPVQCVASDESGNTAACTFTVTLTGRIPPSIRTVELQQQNLTLTFNSQAGVQYLVEFKDDLREPFWRALTEVTGTGGLMAVNTPITGPPARFFRVKLRQSTDPLPGGAISIYEPPEPPPGQPGPSDPCRPALCGPPNVYLFSGEFHYEQTDLCIKGRGLDFVWARKYRSCICWFTAMGYAWDYSYNICIVPNGLNIDVLDGNTRQDTYYPQPDGSFAADQFFREGRFQPDGRFVLTFADGGTWQFLPLDGTPAQGRIERIADRNNNALRFQYDAFGRLANVIDTLDRNIAVSYDSDGFISAVTDFTGRQVRYTHYSEGDADGGFGDLRSVTWPTVTGTPNGNNFPGGKTNFYTYSTGFPELQLNHNLLVVTDAKGQPWLQSTYGTQPDFYCDQVIKQVWGYTDETLHYSYHRQTPVAANGFAIVKAIVNDRVGNVTECYFDAANRCVLNRAFTGRATQGTWTSETVNRPTGKLRAADPDFFDTRHEWNVDSMPVRVSFPNGNRTENVYERDLNPAAPPRSRGNLRVCRKLPGPLGGDQSVLVESFEFEADAGGGCCDFNFVTKQTDARGNVTLHSYDARGNRLHTQHRVPSAVEDWDYNEFGQVTAHLWPDNGTGWRRRDVSAYYGAGPQRGYLAQQIVDAAGLALTTTFEYDTVGNVVRAVDPRGADTLYSVNALNQVMRETSREVTPGGSLRYRRDFFYDANNNLVREDVENRDETGALQANTHFTKLFDYEILNRVVRVAQEKGSAHPLHGVLNYEAIEFALRSQFIAIEYAYDANRNRTLVRHGEATAGFDPFNTVASAYDERDLLFRETRAPGSALASTTQRDYDGNANLIRTSQGLENAPRTTHHAHDGYNRQTRTTDAMGNVTTWRYDANGNCVVVRVDGEPTDLNGGGGNVRLSETLLQYDPMDRETRRDKLFFDPRTQAPIDDGAATTLTFYNDNSQVVRVTDDRGNSTVTVYDSNSRRSTVTDARANSRSFLYDANGNLIAMSELERSDLGNPPVVFTSVSGFDGLDRPTQTVEAGGETNRFAYDSRNNRVWQTDPLNRETRHNYDGLNRLVQAVRDMNASGASAADPADLVTRQTWDDSCRLIAQKDGNGHTTRYAYDALDRRIVTRLADGTMHLTGTGTVNWPDGSERPPLNEFFLNGHDVHDNALRTTDANRTVVVTAFDLFNRPVSKSIVRAPNVLGASFETFQYNGVSLLTHARNNETQVTRGYDSLCHLVRETINFDAPSFPPNRDRVTTWTYDGMDSQLSCTYPGGRLVTRTYDELNRLKRVCEGACVATLAEHSYFGPARVEALCFGNGTCAQFGFDAGRNVTATMHSRPATGLVLDQRSYVVGRDGNKTQQEDARAAGPELSHAYSYDAVSRLVRTVVASPISVAERDSLYTLDRAGNRLNVSSDPPPGNYTLNATLPEPADAQVNQYTSTPFDTGRQYDANGNLASLNDPAGLRTFQYDHRNQLARETIGVSTPILYTYDALGRRVQRVFGNSVTRHFHDGDRELEEQDALGNTLATFVSGLDGAELLTMRRGASDFYFHADDLRSVRVVSDAAGNPVERYEYDDYGDPLVAGRVQAPNAATAFVSDADGTLRVADDFSFTRSVRVLGVRWWGAYFSGAVPPSDNFTIRIHANTAGLPGAVLRTETPGNNARRFATGRVLGSGQVEFTYEAAFAAAFDAAAGTTFWLEMVNNTTGQAASWAIGSAGYGSQVIASSGNSGTSWLTSAADAAFELFTDASPLGNPYLFTGRRYDPANGLYDFGGSSLEPLAGRFTTRDPAGVWADAANLGNSYGFAGNNPASIVSRATETRPLPSIGCGDWTTVDYCPRLAGLWGKPYHCWLVKCGTACASYACCQRTPICREIRCAKKQMRKTQADTSEEAREASQDRRQRGLDNLQKFLDIIRSMNRQI